MKQETPKPIHEQIIDLCGGEEQFKEIAGLKPKQEIKLEDIFNDEIKRFSGTHGFFSTKDFIQSNMIRKDIWDSGNYSIIQCLYSGESFTDIMCGKLATIIYYYNITHLLEYVDRDIVKRLQEYVYYENPNHYLTSVNLDNIYRSSTQQLSENP
jgi:hypothetical protein